MTGSGPKGSLPTPEPPKAMAVSTPPATTWRCGSSQPCRQRAAGLADLGAGPCRLSRARSHDRRVRLRRGGHNGRAGAVTTEQAPGFAVAIALTIPLGWTWITDHRLAARMTAAIGLARRFRWNPMFWLNAYRHILVKQDLGREIRRTGLPIAPARWTIPPKSPRRSAAALWIIPSPIGEGRLRVG